MRRAKRKRKKHILRNKVVYGVAAIAFILVCSFVYSSILSSNQTTVDDTSEPKAAIVDHLSISQPNQTFYLTSRAILEAAGYHVYYYGGGIVTVGFYRTLPKEGFDLIVFRVHSTANCTEEYEPGDYVVFFTCEKYSKTKYVNEQLSYQLFTVRFPYDNQEYFGITPLFVKDSLNGRFKNTIIIMMGCDGLKYTSMAEAFTDRGAKVYVGWNGAVSASHTDQSTIHLLQNFVTENQTIEQAVTGTMNEVGPDPNYNSILSFYPADAGDTVVPSSALNIAQTNVYVFAERRKKQRTQTSLNTHAQT